MPKLRTPQPENRKLYSLLRGHDVTAAQLSRTLRICDNTARKKLQNPGLLTVDDLKRVSKTFGIPYDDIREAIFK